MLLKHKDFRVLALEIISLVVYFRVIQEHLSV